MTINRVAMITGVALLATSTPAAPAHASAPLYSCDSGYVLEMENGSLHVSGHPCSGAWDGYNAHVTLETGPDAGTYFCEIVFFARLGSSVDGFTCHLT
jgi:hypothetical protein